MFADEPELLDEVLESAMQARERDPLRQPVARGRESPLTEHRPVSVNHTR